MRGQKWQSLTSVQSGLHNQAVDRGEGSAKSREHTDALQISLPAPALFCQLEQIFDRLDPPRWPCFFGEELRLSKEETERRVSVQERLRESFQPAQHRMVLGEVGSRIEPFDQLSGALKLLSRECSFDSLSQHSTSFIPETGLQ